MRMPTPVSVTILTKNEELFIERAIRSVSWADEIVVLDSGSTDRTTEIAAVRGARVYQQDWLGWSAQHHVAARLATHDWVLAIDADEIVTAELAQSIQDVLRGPLDDRNGYSVVRRSDFQGVLLPNMQRARKRLGFVRLFNRRMGGYDTSMVVHEEVHVPGRVIPLKGDLVSWRGFSIDHMVASMNRYATIEARVLDDRGVRANALHFAVRPMLRFLWCYVVRGGYRHGAQGLGYAMMKALSEYVRYAKLWELQRGAADLHPAPDLLASSDPPVETACRTS